MKQDKIIINLGRQFASGGREIAKKLCEEFGCRYCDKEILDMAAKESGFSPSFFKHNDEKKSFFKVLSNLQSPLASANNIYGSRFSEDSLFHFQCDAIKKAADTESCLFIGRCADYVLRDRPDTINIFITANLDDRIRRTQARLNVDKDEALKIINKKDSSRASYYNYYTGKRWGAAESYDLCINSSLLGIDETVAFLTEYIKARSNNYSSTPRPLAPTSK